jgi:hypothetical protein
MLEVKSFPASGVALLSDICSLTSDLRPPTSDLRLLTSNIRPPPSDLRLLTS